MLMQVLAKAPGTFNRVGQIFLDTTVFSRKFADSLANDIIDKVKTQRASFEDLAQTYSDYYCWEIFIENRAEKKREKVKS